MLVFRDGRQTVNGPRLLAELSEGLRQLSSTSTLRVSLVVDALLRAGELECALADARDPAARALAETTDRLAAALVKGCTPPIQLESTLQDLTIPQKLSVSRPEGFAYYALHPLDFAELSTSIPVRAGRVAVVGIRSIGTTLSAVVAAAVRSKGIASERITVRPTGHPWNRHLDLTPRERGWINGQNERQADFWVVDEGPGLSGSSFLAVAEALVDASVPRERITLLASSPPDLAALRAPNAAARWTRFRSCFTRPRQRVPAEAVKSICGGVWRDVFLDGAEWPAVWPQFERAKFLKADGRCLLKFEGLGRFGTVVRDRARQSADAGFGPEVYEEENGYARYEVVGGRVPATNDLSPALLEQMAAYCAWRTKAFVAESPSTDELELLIQTNSHEGLGEEAEVPELRIEKPVIADGRMHLHEWRITPEGRLIKLDGASHGDDHFFPGPTDIAWDLAGVIVDWQLQPAAAKFFMERYRLASGDDARARLPAFLLAYSLFRLGYCSMAAESVRTTDEETRFRREAHKYRVLSTEYRAASTIPSTR
jgi:hypothetical protein